MMAVLIGNLRQYHFSLSTATYQSKERTSNFRWVAQEVINQPVQYQYLGVGEDKMILQGVIYLEFEGGLSQIEHMRQEASQGKPMLLVLGTGKVLGNWIILSVTETETIFKSNGEPMKIDFSLDLALQEKEDLLSIGKKIFDEYIQN